jgi:hypothetical protein
MRSCNYKKTVDTDASKELMGGLRPCYKMAQCQWMVVTRLHITDLIC